MARRILDSLTPGWVQIGAVWLPLPHVINMPVVQWDWAYRTGYPSTALSIVVLSAGLAALGATLLRLTRSWPAAVAAPAVILLNPNVLYLQSTPMTEPMLLGLSMLAVWFVARWCDTRGAASTLPAGLALGALTLTRYEGWLIAGALLTFAAIGAWRGDRRRVLLLASYVVVSVLGFLLLSKGSTGVWFVSSGFYEPDLALRHQPGVVLSRVWDGTRALGGTVLLVTGLAGLAVAASALVRGRVAVVVPVALLAAAGLPLYAFFEGHPFRIRYMVPIVAAFGALSAYAIAMLPGRLQFAAALGFVALTTWQRAPLDSRAPMVLEAQWETPYRLARRDVTEYLVREWDGAPILASMGSLAHYMQEASHAGFGIADFVHEGNGLLWETAREQPGRYVRWVLIEERAEGGDQLAARARRDAAYLDGLERVAEGGGVALYRRWREDSPDPEVRGMTP